MPKINLQENCADNFMAAYSSLIILASCCIYPNDEEKREQFVKIWSVKILHHFEDALPQLEQVFSHGIEGEKIEIIDEINTDLPTLQLSPATTFEEFQSKFFENIVKPSLILPEDIERFLMKALGTYTLEADIKKSLKSLMTAAVVVFNLMRMEKVPKHLLRGGVSAKKAMKILESKTMQSAMKEHTHKNLTDINKAWKDYKKSVPLFVGAIFCLMIKDISKDNETIREAYKKDPGKIRVMAILVFAKFVQDWMLSLKISSHSTKNKLVTKKELWMLPDWCLGSASAPFNLLKPFDAEEVKLINRLP